MFRIKAASGETIISFRERGEWEFSIDKYGYVELLTQKDIDAGKVDGGKPIKKFATHERAMAVVQDMVKAIVNANYGRGPKFYILPEE